MVCGMVALWKTQRRSNAVDLPAWLYARFAVVAAATVLAVLSQGFRTPLLDMPVLTRLLELTATVLLGWSTWSAVRRRGWRALGYLLPEHLAAGALWTLGFVTRDIGAILVGAWLLALVLRFFLEVMEHSHRPSLLFIVGFAGLIVLGAATLKLPVAVPHDQPISWLDALFTATSAVCVTGLIVRDTATEFTRFGQFVILAMIQLGGLGIVSYAAFVILLSGRTLNLRLLSTVGGAAAAQQAGPIVVRKLVRFILISTLLLEAVGALFLVTLLPSSAAWDERLFTGVFMSISAFCNAGFAVFSDSLTQHRWTWQAHAVIAPLIVLGGLGFPVLMNLYEALWPRLRHALRREPRWERPAARRLSLHTKLVLLTTLALYLLGTAGVLIGQGIEAARVSEQAATAGSALPHADERMPGEGGAAQPQAPPLTPAQRLLDASFLSITARTAGFNTMPMAELAPSTRFVTIMLMFVGGSPGSTAGGVKTITLAILVLLVWSTLRNRPGPEALGRRLQTVSVQRAATLVTLGALTVAATITLLRLTEGAAETALTFEAVSACSTVGLSLNVTPTLSSGGRVVLILAMFAGRLGPLTLLAALMIRRRAGAQYEYPEEGVVAG
jgi:trk system potassium uptake protein TrkH